MGNQRISNNKSGLGYNGFTIGASFSNESGLNIFQSKQKVFKANLSNSIKLFPKPAYHSHKTNVRCFFCNHIGHTVKYCAYKRNKQGYTLEWRPKLVSQVIETNPSGPNSAWVPKTNWFFIGMPKEQAEAEQMVCG